MEGAPFQPVEKDTNFTIAGESFTLRDGLFGLSILNYLPYRNRVFDPVLAFRPYASRSFYFATIKDILKSARTQTPLVYKSAIDVLPTQASVISFSSDGTLFYGLAEETSIGCWNTKKILQPRNLVITP